MAKTYTVKEVATALGFSTNTVYKYLEEGKIKSTRLGTEGRFRIAESEVMRLIGEDKPEDITSPTLLESGQEEVGVDKTEALLEKFTKHPTSQTYRVELWLFEWFMACLGIFIGISALLFSPLTISTNSRNGLDIILFVKAFLIFLGIVFILSELFLNTHKVRHYITHLVYGLIFIVLSILFYQVNNLVGVVGYGLIGLFALVGCLTSFKNLFHFLVFVHILAALIGLTLAFRPGDLSLGVVSFWISEHKLIIVSIWLLLVGIACWLNMRAYFKNQYSKSGILILVLMSISTCLASISNGNWDQSIFIGVLSVFLIAIPFWEKIENLSSLPRKDFFSAVAWLFIIPLVGASIAYYLQSSFNGELKKSILDQADKASQIVESALRDSQLVTKSFKDDPELISLLSEKNKDTKEIDAKVKELFLTSRIFRRITLLDESGKVLSLYPADASIIGYDASSKDYFQIAKSSSGIFVSGIYPPIVNATTPVLLTSVAIRDSQSNLLGVASDSLDFKRLEGQLLELKQDSKSNFRIADNKKEYVLTPDLTQIAKKVPAGSALSNAVDGQTGVVEVYNEQGELSLRAHTPVGTYHWGLVEEQPLAELIRPSLITSFAIFIITTISGLFSFLTYVFLKKREYEY